MAFRAKQTFQVTAGNSVFIYRYAIVLNAANHICSQQPFFNINFSDGNGNVIPCSNYQVTAIGSSCNVGDPSFITSGVMKYKPWSTASFDLTAYIGQNVSIEFTVGGCIASQAGHGGYAYIDASCQPMSLNLNGSDIPVGQTNSIICAAGTNTLCAPLGFTSYSWSGPGVTGGSTRCVTAGVSGTYSVTLGMAGASCNSPVLYSNFSLIPSPISDFTYITTPCQTTFSVPFQNTASPNGGPAITSYTWNWGDGSPVGTNPSETHLFSSAGTKTVSLKVSNGCSDSITKVIIVSPQPTANFTVTSSCLNTTSNFISTTTSPNPVTSQVWNWGDNTAPGTGSNPSHTYNTIGTYTVKLVATDVNSCKDSINKIVTVYPNPVVNFAANPVCLGAASSFSNTSTIAAPDNITAYSWDFDNNGTPDSSVPTPTNTYPASGSYVVKLTATSNHSCVTSSTASINVNTIPTVTFAPANACMNATVALNNTSSIPLPDNLSAYNWNFGPNATPAQSTQQHPGSLSYSTAGVKTITLGVTANTGCAASITRTVMVYQQPVANFSTTSVCFPGTTAFTDLSTTTAGTIQGWDWDFTTNGSIDNSTQAPSLAYPSSGTYTAGLTVTTSNGCKGNVALPVNVWGHSIPDFSPVQACYGTATTFTNLTNTTTNANVGGTPNYVWTFDDGTPSSTVNAPVHTYTLGANSNAVYSVTLTSTTVNGCLDNIVKSINVYAAPTASFTSNLVCEGSATQHTDASNGNGSPVNGYQWDFLNNGTVDATGLPVANYIYPTYGINAVSYTVSTTPAAGLTCFNSVSTLTVFVDPTPLPDFNFVNNCINAQPNSFDAGISSIPVGSITSYFWGFGDATIGSGITIDHAYATPAVYNVTLTVRSALNCTATKVKQVEVYRKPMMSITHSPACDGKAMSFTAVEQPNSGTATNWFWDYDNAINTIEASGQANVSYIYPAAGNQWVGLVTESSPGQCRDTLKLPVYVDYTPVPTFSVDKPGGCPVHCVNLTNTTAQIMGPGQNVSWRWEFGDGSTVSTNNSTAVQPHCYNNSSSSQVANYDIKLVVTTDRGCVDSLTENAFVKVYPTPIAAYNVSPNPGNVVTPMANFNNESVDYTRWFWTFGDGPIKSDSVNVNPAHIYFSETAKTYQTNLIVINQYGCSDTAYVTVEIGPEFSFYIPNAFTPGNGDGVNDVFMGAGIGIETYEMWIYDRWGEMLYNGNDITKGWNGKKAGKGDEVKQDTYIWKVKIKDVLGKKHEYVGHVTLLR